MVRAGYLPLSMLRTVAPGTQLAGATASAFLNMVLIAKMLDGTRITPAGPIGAGYRSWGLALDFYKAGQGDQAARKRLHIDPHLHVSIAYPPGSHGLATRIDMLFNGHSPESDDLALAAWYGFRREFGAKDKNHFMHDGVTAIHGARTYHKNILLGRFYNEMDLGRHTSAERTGLRDDAFYWLAQTYNRRTGDYPKPYHVDGITGPKTDSVIQADWMMLRARAA